MADAAAIGVGKAAAIEELRRQPGRVEAAERRLRMGGIGDWKVSGLLACSMATVGKEEVFDQCRTRSR
jgi:hypothetical protein